MKRGQAALEFLTTYGWAFVVILIMISALTYFGVLKPHRLLPDRCTVSPQFSCEDFQISVADSSIKILMKNNVGDPIRIESLSIEAGNAQAILCGIQPDLSGIWTVGEARIFSFGDCDSNRTGFTPGDKGKVLFTMRYHSVRSGPDFAHDTEGEILSTVV
jgi:hypothetical protein